MRNQIVIRSLIREMLNEVMRTPIDAKMPGMKVDVRTSNPKEITILLSINEFLHGKDARVKYGVLVATKKNKPQNAPCLGAWEVTWADAKEGWGPFLYHLMLQIIEERDPNSGGLMADRSAVSVDAFNVWKKFNSGISPSIEKLQLDDPFNTLTDVTEDNCGQNMNSAHFGDPGYGEKEERERWLKDSPITKAYRRKPGARDWKGELIEMGIYYENGVQVSPWDAE